MRKRERCKQQMREYGCIHQKVGVWESYRSVEVKQNTENEKNRNREKKDKREYSKDMLVM